MISKATIQYQTAIIATPAIVWRAFTDKISHWWPLSFCAEPSRARAFRADFRLGGLLYEDWGNGDGWVWYTIYKLDHINFSFAATGLMNEGTTSNITLTIKQSEAGVAILHIAETIIGEIDNADALIQSQLAGWEELIGNAFKPFVESKAR